MAEAMVRGRYPIALGLLKADIREFRDQGLAGNLKYLDPPELDFQSGDGLLIFNKAPHPNAAKVFVNWMLSKEGQRLWCRAAGTNSRRTDVAPNNEEAQPTPGVQYRVANLEQFANQVTDTQKFINELVEIKN